MDPLDRTLGAGEIARVAHGAGFRGRALERAVAVALAESGGRVGAHNAEPPDDSYGLWQINMYGSLGPDRRAAYGLRSDGALFDPQVNARAAWAISRHGRDFTPWTTFTRGRYHRFLGTAREAVARKPWTRGAGADAWARARPAHLRPWQRLRQVRGGGGRKAMTFAWVDGLTGHLTEYLAEAEAVDRTTRSDARELDIERLRLADARHDGALRRALEGVLDDRHGLPRLCRSFARDVELVVRAEANFRAMDVDGRRTVRSLAASLTDGHGRRYAGATARGAEGWLAAVLTPRSRRLATSPRPRRDRAGVGAGEGGRGNGALPDHARPTGRLGSYGNERFDTGVLPFVRRLDAEIPGLRLTSGWRSAAENAAANGATNSFHLQGRAADFVGPDALLQRGATWARRHGAAEVLVHDAGSGLHLHVAW